MYNVLFLRGQNTHYEVTKEVDVNSIQVTVGPTFMYICNKAITTCIVPGELEIPKENMSNEKNNKHSIIGSRCKVFTNVYCCWRR